MKRFQTHAILPALVAALGLLIAGCGHKGELYLPGKDEKGQTTQRLAP
ncbi:MAG: lipoprotein [Magnetococcales bacterium]|nr:lipoprotein [Magnetococcales bacterium]